MELVKFSSRGGFSVRSIVTFVLTVVITALLWVLSSYTPTMAQATPESTNEASWNGASLMYGGNQYISAGTSQGTESHNIPKDATLYVYVEQASGTVSTQTPQKAHVIYFAPGADPPTATSATYVTYTYVSSSKTYSNPSSATAVTVNASTADSGGSSCAIEGVGWIVCGVTNFLAWGMDFAFDIIAGFMEVQPLQTNTTDNGLYQAWNIMRGIGNIAFIIAFLIIIYSQLTSIGISNYGLKRILPRLVIAAIAVNMSYIICAVAVDISNVLGYSLQEVFLSMRSQVFATSSAGFNEQMVTWQSISGFVLSGGTATLALGVGVVSALGATGGSITALVFLILPTLVGLLLAILVVLLVLAARQALITILIIIAPLAIVAYLLPNTEKWFEKWRDLLMTMLIFFPAFSVVFGGSQLAGAIIIYNASSINMVILGMIVQVAPLVITPLLLKFSGSLLGRIAQIANNPNKGLIDRSRKWSNERANWHRDRSTGRLDRYGNPINKELTKRNFLRNSARNLDQRKKRLADRTANAATATQTAYENSDLYAKSGKYDMAQQKAYVEHQKEATHNHHAEHVDKARRTQGSLVYQAGIDARASKERAEASQNYTESFYNNARRNEKLAGGALHASGYKLELSKDKRTTSENLSKAYFDEQRATKGTDLYAAVKPLETSKLRVEAAQSNYTAMVDSMKVAPGTAINRATQNAQAAKDRAETAQAQVTEYINTIKATPGTELHVSKIRLEDAKLKAQASETALTQVVDEYKTGRLEREGELGDLATSMVQSVEMQAAHARGVQAAQNIQQRNISEALTEQVTIIGDDGKEKIVSSDRADALLTIAGSVDENGRTRAKAAATSQLNQIEQEALKNNITLLEDQADAAGINSIEWSRDIFKRHIDGTKQDPAILEAALQKLAADGDIGSIRTALITKLGGDDDEYKPMLNRVIARTQDTLKAKGGFDIQQKVSKLWGASREEMDVSIAGSLGAISAEHISGQKWGWWHSFTQPDENGDIALQRIINNVESMPESKDKEFAKDMLRSFYSNMTTALTSSETMAKIGDRNEDTLEMHKLLQSVPGLITEPVILDYSLTKKGIANPKPDSRATPADPDDTDS